MMFKFFGVLFSAYLSLGTYAFATPKCSAANVDFSSIQKSVCQVEVKWNKIGGNFGVQLSCGGITVYEEPHCMQLSGKITTGMVMTDFLEAAVASGFRPMQASETTVYLVKQ
jgi:hypothetical protein